MAEGRDKHVWAHTSVIGAFIYNHVITDKKHLISPDTLNPYAGKHNRQKTRPTQSGWGDAALLKKEWTAATGNRSK